MEVRRLGDFPLFGVSVLGRNLDLRILSTCLMTIGPVVAAAGVGWDLRPRI